MYLPKDVQGCGYLLKGVTLSLNEIAQPLSKEGVLPPQKEVITLFKDMSSPLEKVAPKPS